MPILFSLRGDSVLALFAEQSLNGWMTAWKSACTVSFKGREPWWEGGQSVSSCSQQVEFHLQTSVDSIRVHVHQSDRYLVLIWVFKLIFLFVQLSPFCESMVTRRLERRSSKVKTRRCDEARLTVSFTRDLTRIHVVPIFRRRKQNFFIVCPPCVFSACFLQKPCFALEWRLVVLALANHAHRSRCNAACLEGKQWSRVFESLLVATSLGWSGFCLFVGGGSAATPWHQRAAATESLRHRLSLL